MADKFLTTDDAAVKLGVSRRTVQLWLSQGRIAGAFKVGRDWLIPVENGHALYEGCSAADKHLVTVPGAGHNDLMFTGQAEYVDAIRAVVLGTRK